MSSMVGDHPLHFASGVLMTAARTAGGPAYQGTIDEMDRELTKVTEDFIRAVNLETLCVAEKSGKHSLSQIDDVLF
jgi:hypothetical protein